MSALSKTKAVDVTEVQRQLRLEFEYPRLERLLDRRDLFLWRGEVMQAAAFVAEAKECRNIIEEIEAQCSSALLDGVILDGAGL